jgi:zinc D-Ala-D-Ala carboxypeptidase
MTKLSAHFTLEEFTFSDTAARMRINNSVPPDLMVHVEETADMLERIRAALCAVKGRDIGIRVTSGYRCLALNRAIGSSDTSDHLKGYAADIVAPDFGTPLQLAKFIAASQRELGVGQVIHEFGRWVHVSPMLPEKAINMAITIDHTGTRPGICEVCEA